jgi:O-antigen/teichoic acid export membrane protein
MIKQKIALDTAIPVYTHQKSTFTFDVLKIVLGTTIAQMLSIIAAPILTRLYTPQDFGVFALFVSFSGILGAIACLRYEYAIMLPETEGEAANLLIISIILACSISLISFFVFWLGRQFIAEWLQIESISSYLWLIASSVLVTGVFQALNYWNSRTKNFAQLSIAKIVGSVVTTAFMLGLGFAGHGTSGVMIGSSIVGQVVTTIILGIQIYREHAKLFRESICLQGMTTTIKRYRKFLYYDTWSTLLNVTSWQLPIFMLSLFFSSKVVGFYSLGYRILQMPMSLIGNAIAQVFFQRAVSAKAKGTLNSLVEQVFRQLVTLSLFPLLVLCLVGKDLFFVIFGPNWIESGIYVQILSIWAFFWFISSPLSILFSSIEKQEYMLRWNTINFCTRFASLWIGGILQDARIAIILFSSSGVFVYGYIIVLILKQAEVELHKAGQIVLVNFLFFLPFGLILTYLILIDFNIRFRLLISAVLSICYLFYVIKMHLSTIRSINTA